MTTREPNNIIMVFVNKCYNRQVVLALVTDYSVGILCSIAASVTAMW
jgi:hypothetical protein